MLLFQNHLHERLETSFADPAGRSSLERHMQPARFKLHAEERTCNPVRRPSLRSHCSVMHLPWLEPECTNPGLSPRGQPGAREQNKRTSVDRSRCWRSGCRVYQGLSEKTISSLGRPTGNPTVSVAIAKHPRQIILVYYSGMDRKPGDDRKL